MHSTTYFLFLSKSLLIFNFFFLLFTFIFCSLLFFFSRIQYFQKFSLKNDFVVKVQYLLFVSLLISFFVNLVSFFVYCFFFKKYLLSLYLNSFFFLPTISYLNYFSFDFFGFILLFLAYIVGIISFLTLDTRFYWKNVKYLFSMNFFTIVVYLYVSTSNIFLFFFFYELLLLPSVFVVYFVSNSRRAIQACLYFIIWTQIGSFLVLCAISYIVSTTGLFYFYELNKYVFTSTEVFYLYALIFFGFGFKVPIWPFHYWLTKTHVEAPSGFSIYLSGFLVKSALYGFYKITSIFGLEIDTTFFLVICFLGVIDASMKMWGQTDLKKLVAYGTIQEMNLIYLTLMFGDTYAVYAAMLFTATHAFLSALMFFIVDCIYRRFHTRSVVEVTGILHLTPNLGVVILVMCIFFAGLPGTIKFISEFYIFSGLFSVSVFSCALLMFLANVFGLIGFSKNWYNAVFGMNTKNFSSTTMDLTFKEIYITGYCFFFIFFFSFFPVFFF